MKDLYVKGDEKFGPVTSFLYFASVKLFAGGLYRFVINDVRRAKGKSLIDIGTGPGDVPVMIERLGKFKRICAVDPSNYFIGITKRRFGESKVDFRIGSSRSLPYKEKFDLIIAVLSYHHWYGKENSLRYLSGFLSKGGEIRLYEYSAQKLRTRRFVKYTHTLDTETIRDTAKSAGLKVREIFEKGILVRVTMVKRGL